MSDPARILVVRLSALGDVLLATPAVRSLARRFPDARIDWLVEESYLPLLAANPYARAIAYRKQGVHAGVRGLLSLRRALAAQSYDLVVDLQDKPKTRLFRGLAPLWVAFHKRTRGQALLSLVGQERPLTRAHAVDLYLEALSPLGVEADGAGLDLKITDGMQAQAAPVLPAGRIAGMAPGSRWATKRWPARRFAELTVALRERGYSPLLLGGPGDAEAFAAVRAGLDFTVGDTAALDVGGLAAAVAHCALVVSGDTGPAHLAWALQVPQVVLFGPTSPERWRPMSQCAEVVRLPLWCSPCSNYGTETCPEGHHGCMVQLGVEPVLEAADRVAGPR
jgi:heptosyltransferase-2